MIKPIVGRSILFRPIDEDEGDEHAAIIAFVHDDNHVNLAIFDSNGLPYNRQNVYLNQEPDDTVYRGQAYCLIYQHGQAAKTIEIDLESTKNIVEEALESGDAEIITMNDVAAQTGGVMSSGDHLVIDDNNQPEIAGSIINRRLASHQINQDFAVQ